MQIDWNDPIGSLERKQFEIKQEHGLYPDRVSLSREAYERLAYHPDIRARIKTTPEHVAAIIAPPGVDFLLNIDDEMVAIDASYSIAGGQVPRPGASSHYETPSEDAGFFTDGRPTRDQLRDFGRAMLDYFLARPGPLGPRGIK